MSFNKVIGQELAVDLLKKAIEEKRLAHAYLFIGPDGVGKSLLAKIFAKALNCEKQTAEACDECVPCKKIEGNIHPDVITVSPEGKSSQIGIDAIRKIEKAMSLKPYEGRTKVFTIDGADKMTEEAANSLLKTLEEPPKETVLVLLASNMFKLQPTIVSRCQKVLFHPLNERAIMKELIERYGLDDKKAMCVSRFSEGRLGRAIEVLEGEALAKRDRVVDEFLTPKQLDYEDTWLYGEPREKVNEALNALAVYFRDLLVFNLSKDQGLLVNLDKAADIARDAARYPVERLEGIIETIADTQERIKRNANIKIALSCMRLNIT
ncbi:MAG: DNA polymerase III subunit delta' [Omnitrophica WOR_2 bacterium RIFCSPHIGHO2_01_FULL_49_10]|nr:MAG: DNA polymerase III subunit delta' [Omnitrophica WOR_2 bacterium RIFCSPHIGHO2_01_FULL_49_10]OGX35193.1 MAG: DNA polymerase III subunit delta' [Omnitrophica WOR_2 bacterium RIFCSPLOWO2_02_FULL_50_19]